MCYLPWLPSVWENTVCSLLKIYSMPYSCLQNGMPGSLAVSKIKTSTIRRKSRGPVVKTKKENVFTIKDSQTGDSTEPSLVYFEVPEVCIATIVT